MSKNIVWRNIDELIIYKEEKSSSSYLKDYMKDYAGVLDSVHGYLMSKYSDNYFKLSSIKNKKLLLLRK